MAVDSPAHELELPMAFKNDGRQSGARLMLADEVNDMTAAEYAEVINPAAIEHILSSWFSHWADMLKLAELRFLTTADFCVEQPGNAGNGGRVGG
eukprot:1342939-Prymnesium_polylepis.1